MQHLPAEPAPPRPVRVWDAPTRLFHWALVLLIGFSWLSAENSWIDWHMLSGETILTLLVFRVIWGFIGSDTARFSRFLASPFAALRHLAHLHRREPDIEIGHNAAGGWMVVALLLLVATQAGLGLFANDDAGTFGPLASLVTRRDSNKLTAWHAWLFNYLLIAIALHVLAVLTYFVLKRHNLLGPMITGVKRLPASLAAPRLASPILAFAALLIAAAAVYALTHFLK